MLGQRWLYLQRCWLSEKQWQKHNSVDLLFLHRKQIRKKACQSNFSMSNNRCSASSSMIGGLSLMIGKFLLSNESIIETWRHFHFFGPSLPSGLRAAAAAGCKFTRCRWCRSLYAACLRYHHTTRDKFMTSKRRKQPKELINSRVAWERYHREKSLGRTCAQLIDVIVQKKVDWTSTVLKKLSWVSVSNSRVITNSLIDCCDLFVLRSNLRCTVH